MSALNHVGRVRRSDFLINDLTISVSRGVGGGSVFMPGPDTETPPSVISPIASVLVNIDYIHVVREIVADAIRNKGDLGDIGRAFVDGDSGGSPAIRVAIQEVGKAIVASAAYAAMSGRGPGGEAGLVDPNCGGTSFETIPATTSPVVHLGRRVHQVGELGRIREQLKVAVQGFEKAAVASKPQAAEIGAVREVLQGALNAVGH